MSEIQRITLALPLRMGAVNCYLLKVAGGFALIDSGSSSRRRQLAQTLADAGVMPGTLKAILLTHGDFDHTGNAAYLRQQYGAQIGMGEADTAMASQGDMFANRKQPHFLIRKLVPLLFGFGSKKRFQPDFLLSDGQDLAEMGLPLTVTALPGHSQGSVGFLTAEGELFSGDLLENVKGVGLSTIMDDLEAADASLEVVRGLGAAMIFPGHGEPFPASALP